MKHPLSDRVSVEMARIWADDWAVRAERRFWLYIMRWLSENTEVYSHIDDMATKLEAYQQAASQPADLERIRKQEMVTKHDLKARLEVYNQVATERYQVWGGDRSAEPLELAHWGMTSADVVDNIALIRMKQSMRVILGRLLWDWSSGMQPVAAYDRLQLADDAIPFRGLKGPVGTQQDMLDLLNGDIDRLQDLELALADAFDFGRVINSCGQVYPRSIDTEVATGVCAAIACCDHSQPWLVLANGYMSMIVAYSGDQWNEGDVSTSVVRRVALPGLFATLDCATRSGESEP